MANKSRRNKMMRTSSHACVDMSYQRLDQTITSLEPTVIQTEPIVVQNEGFIDITTRSQIVEAEQDEN
jgi:hypothetical protein